MGWMCGGTSVVHTGKGSTTSLCKPCLFYLDAMAQLCHQLDGPMASKLYFLVLRLRQNKSNVCAQSMMLDPGKCREQVTSLSPPLFSQSVTDV